jgi:hypothetical protein
METFFFLSLGITFVLIFLIVYHFKQRITTVEHKSDTMFEIVQNLAKEVSIMKSEINNLSVKEPFGAIYNSSSMPQNLYMPIIRPFHEENLENKVVEELEKISENDEEMNESDDDSDDSDSDSDDESIMYTGEEYDADYFDSQKSNDTEFKKIKVSDDDNNSVIIKEEISEVLETDQICELDTIVNAVASQQDLLAEEKQSDLQEEDYKKMSLGELKKLAASKGIQKDLTRLKRQDLLKLLSDA